jgi:hypothetical protein
LIPSTNTTAMCMMKIFTYLYFMVGLYKRYIM